MNKKLKFIGLGVALAILMVLLVRQGAFMGLQRSLQNKFYDFASASSEVVVVAIDEKSLRPENLGPLQQWKRENYAKAIQILNEKGAAAIGIDITFPDASSHSEADDQAFRDALKHDLNVVLAGRYFFENGQAAAEWPNSTILEAKPKVGWINVGLDEDGFVRKLPIFIAVEDKTAEAFSLEVAREYLKTEPVDYKIQKGVFKFSEDVSIPVMTLRDPNTKKDTTMMYVNYFAEPGGYTRLSFSDLLDGKIIDAKGKIIDLTDKIVLIGPTAADLQDQYLSPVSRGVKMPGVEIHANNVQTIVSGKFLRDQSPLSLWLTIFGLILVNLFLFSRLRVRYAIPIALLELFGILVAGILGYEYRIFLNVIYPLLTVLLTFIGTFLLRFILEQKERTFLEGAFGHYVSKEVVEQIIKNPHMLELGGAKRDVTVFFSDIAGFTSVSEQMEPEALVKFLNTYLSAMTNIILNHQGTLDKYEGDAIMAFWGAPIPQADHAIRACLAAIEDQKQLAKLREEWMKKGLPPLHIRIGLNTGEAVAGNMGSESRFDYTVMGDNVNLASRLEGISKQYGTEIIISEATKSQLSGDFVCRELDLIRVKGKEQPVKIFELVGLKDEVMPEKLMQIETFEKALLAYRAKNFLMAQQQFSAIQNDPPSGVFVKRCEQFLASPPSEGWDGVFTFTEK